MTLGLASQHNSIYRQCVVTLQPVEASGSFMRKLIKTNNLVLENKFYCVLFLSCPIELQYLVPVLMSPLSHFSARAEYISGRPVLAETVAHRLRSALHTLRTRPAPSMLSDRELVSLSSCNNKSVV